MLDRSCSSGVTYHGLPASQLVPDMAGALYRDLADGSPNASDVNIVLKYRWWPCSSCRKRTASGLTTVTPHRSPDSRLKAQRLYSEGDGKQAMQFVREAKVASRPRTSTLFWYLPFSARRFTRHLFAWAGVPWPPTPPKTAAICPHAREVAPTQEAKRPYIMGPRLRDKWDKWR